MKVFTTFLWFTVHYYRASASCSRCSCFYFFAPICLHFFHSFLFVVNIFGRLLCLLLCCPTIACLTHRYPPPQLLPLPLLPSVGRTSRRRRMHLPPDELRPLLRAFPPSASPDAWLMTFLTATTVEAEEEEASEAASLALATVPCRNHCRCRVWPTAMATPAPSEYSKYPSFVFISCTKLLIYPACALSPACLFFPLLLSFLAILYFFFFGNNFESRVAPEVLSCCPIAASSFDLFLISLRSRQQPRPKQQIAGGGGGGGSVRNAVSILS